MKLKIELSIETIKDLSLMNIPEAKLFMKNYNKAVDEWRDGISTVINLFYCVEMNESFEKNFEEKDLFKSIYEIIDLKLTSKDKIDYIFYPMKTVIFLEDIKNRFKYMQSPVFDKSYYTEYIARTKRELLLIIDDFNKSHQ
jgi:hypothetical protein